MGEIAVGIDLGTSTSAVAFVRDGRPEIVPNREGAPLTPSLVGFNDQGERLVGEIARLEADAEPTHVASATKRWIGRRYSPELAAENEKILPVQINGKRRAELKVPAGLAEAEVEKIALADEAVLRHLEGQTVVKVIVVKDRIVNIVAR